MLVKKFNILRKINTALSHPICLRMSSTSKSSDKIRKNNISDNARKKMKKKDTTNENVSNNINKEHQSLLNVKEQEIMKSEKDDDVEKMQEPKVVEEEVLIYESKFGNRIKSLRRISFASSLTCLGFLGSIAAGLSESSSLNLTAQYSLVGATCFTSVNATLILKAITEPYVLKLWEQMPQPQNKIDHGKRSFRAKTINIYGMEVDNIFSLNDVSKSSHPFATCLVQDKNNEADKGKSLYIFDKLLQDKNLKSYLIKKH